MNENIAIKDLLILDNEIAISWNDNEQSFVSLKVMRDKCPCAFCSGEKDVLGNVYKGPKQNLAADAYKVRNVEKIGHYAIRIFWSDNHADGLYTYEFIRTLSRINEN